MHVAPTIYGVLRFSPSRARTRFPPPPPPPASFLPSLFASRPHVAFTPPVRPSRPLRPSFPLCPKSRQHLASSILGEIQADILSRAITVTFDHRMTGEWLTLRHQGMNFSLSARYNLQSARWPSPDPLGPTGQFILPSPTFSSFFPYHPCERFRNDHRRAFCFLVVTLRVGHRVIFPVFDSSVVRYLGHH